MKVKPASEVAVAAARRVLAEADVRHPGDIQVEALAARHGAMVLYRAITTARASIVRAGKRAVICVDERDRGQPRARFTIAHELGHHLLHEVADHFEQCDGSGVKRSGTAWRIETEADQFSAELLMPASLGAALCTAARPALDDVERLARTFGTSFEASGIRYVQLTEAPCAFVLAKGGRVKWATESAAFPGKIVKGRELDARSVAATLVGRRAGCEEAPREVPGAAWGAGGGGAMLEHAIALGGEKGVLSWVVAGDSS